MRRISALGLLAVFASSAFGGSDTPPEGPPWQRDLLEAQAQALKSGTPVFCYFTKTY